MIASAVLSALAVFTMPAHAHIERVALSGHSEALTRVADPAHDTCMSQWAYVDRRGRTVAEYAGCWHELDNWTRHRLVITYKR